MPPNLNLDCDYFAHPKTRRLIGLLGKGSEVVPLRLWAYCGKYHPKDGRLTEYSAQEIESCIGWWGHEGRAVDALLKVGFLERDGDGYRVHDWEEHQGHIHALKQKQSHAANARWDKLKGRSANGNAGGNATGNAPAIPAIPDQEHPPNPPVPGGRVVVGARRGRETKAERAARKRQDTIDAINAIP